MFGLRMSKYRVVYSCNSYVSHCFVRARSEEEAKKKFRKLKGHNPVITAIEKLE